MRLIVLLCASMFTSTFSIGAFPALLPDIGRTVQLGDNYAVVSSVNRCTGRDSKTVVIHVRRPLSAM